VRFSEALSQPLLIARPGYSALGVGSGSAALPSTALHLQALN
jgi:hypothetical protein